MYYHYSVDKSSPIDDFVKYQEGQFLWVILFWMVGNAILVLLIVVKNSIKTNTFSIGTATNIFSMEFYFAVWLFITALITPLVSTGFIFNGPKYPVPEILKPVFDEHYKVYSMNLGPIKAWTTLSLAMYVVLFVITAVFSTLGLILELIPFDIRSVFGRVQTIITSVLGLLCLIPGLLTLGGWVCWVLALVMPEILARNTVLWDLWHLWHEQMVAFIQGNEVIPGVLDKIIQPFFGKLY